MQILRGSEIGDWRYLGESNHAHDARQTETFAYEHCLHSLSFSSPLLSSPLLVSSPDLLLSIARIGLCLCSGWVGLVGSDRILMGWDGMG